MQLGYTSHNPTLERDDDRHRERRWRWRSPAGGKGWHLTNRKTTRNYSDLCNAPNDITLLTAETRTNVHLRRAKREWDHKSMRCATVYNYNTAFGPNDWISIEVSYQFISVFILHFKFTGKYVFGILIEGNYKCTYE